MKNKTTKLEAQVRSYSL